MEGTAFRLLRCSYSRLGVVFLFLAIFIAPRAGALTLYPLIFKVVEPNGAPLPALLVSCARLGGAGGAGITDGSGEVRLSLPVGAYTCRTLCTGQASLARPVTVPRARPYVQVIPLRTTRVETRLLFSAVNTPVDGAVVTMTNALTNVHAAGPASSNSQGVASFALAPGLYAAESVYLGARRRAYVLAGWRAVSTLPAGRLELSVTRGTQPAADIEVEVRPAADPTHGLTARTDALGRAVLTLPEGAYRVLAREGGEEISTLLTIRRDLTQSASLKLANPHPPGASFRATPRQLIDGSDRVEFSILVTDSGGDPCRIGLEYSLDGGNFLPATVSAQGLLSARAGSDGPPDVDNSSFPQIGHAIPLPTDPEAPNILTFLWEASRDLPRLETCSVRLRLTAIDAAGGRSELLSGSGWRPLGEAVPAAGIIPGGHSRVPEVAVDAQGRPHLAWIERWPEGERVAYLRWDGHDWVDGDGSGREGILLSPLVDAVGWLSMALDEQGRPRIAWAAATSGSGESWRLRDAVWEGGAWISTLPEGGIATGAAPCLVLRIDRQGRSHLVFADAVAQGVRLRHLVRQGDRWSGEGGSEASSVIAVTNGRLEGLDLALDAAGRPHVIWSEALPDGSRRLNYRFFDGQGWRSSAPDLAVAAPNPGFVYMPRILLVEGYPRIFWEDSSELGTRVFSTAWDGSAWSLSAPLTEETSFSSSPFLDLAGHAAVALVRCPDEGCRPTLLVHDGVWTSWEGLPDTSLLAGPGLCYVAAALDPAGIPFLAVEDDREDAWLIHALVPDPGVLGLDTLPPRPAGVPRAAPVDSPDLLRVEFGAPAVEDHFAGYFLEGSASPDFSDPVTLADGRDRDALRRQDFNAEPAILVSRVPPGMGFFRLTALDRAGHRSASPGAGPIEMPSDTDPPLLSLDLPTDGSITPDTAVLVAGRCDDPRAAITINGHAAPLIGTSFWYPLSLDEGDNVIIVLARDPEGRVTATELTVVSIPVRILSPPDGLAAPSSWVDVIGSAGVSCVSVGYEALLAVPEDGRFEFPSIPLVPGENRLVFAGCDVLGRCAGRTLTLDGPPPGEETVLEATPADGTAPLEVWLSIHGPRLNPGWNYAWDVDGDGIVESGGRYLTSLPWRFETPGTFLPTLVISYQDVVLFRGSTPLTIQRAAQPSARFPVDDPCALALAPTGTVVIADCATRHVVLLSPALEPIRTIEVDAAGRSFGDALALAIDERSRIWVADATSRRLSLFDPDGAPIGSWLLDAAFVKLACNDRFIHAVTATGARIQTYLVQDGSGSPQLAVLAGTSLPETGPGSSLAALDGYLYVAREGAHRILSFFCNDDAGQLDPRDDLPAPVWLPAAIAFCPTTGDLAEVESGTGQVVLYHRSGKVLGRVPREVSGLESFARVGGVGARQVQAGTMLYLADRDHRRITALLLPGDDPLHAVTAFRAALAADDRTALEGLIHPFGREKILPLLDELGGRWGEVASYFDRISFESVAGDTARCSALRRTTFNGVTGDFIFEIMLLKDQRGEWRIFSF